MTVVIPESDSCKKIDRDWVEKCKTVKMENYCIWEPNQLCWGQIWNGSVRSILWWWCNFECQINRAIWRYPPIVLLYPTRLKLPLSKPSRYQASTVNCWLMESKFNFTRSRPQGFSLGQQRNVWHTNWKCFLPNRTKSDTRILSE